MSSSQSAIPKTYTVQTNSHNTASKAKKPSHGSHSVSVNCNEMSTNYSDTVAYFRITNNTFGARLNPPELETFLLPMMKSKMYSYFKTGNYRLIVF